jgi:hypothetical protein
MAEQQKEETQKTVVSFIVGLLVGGLLVWAFTGAPEGEHKDDKKAEDGKEMTSEKSEEKAVEAEKLSETETPKMAVGEGEVKVEAPAAGKVVALDAATFPTEEGWVGVRSLSEGKLGMILGVARFSKEQGLIPKEIELVTPTISGREYAIVFYSESGDRKFNLANDIQIDKQFATFTAK